MKSEQMKMLMDGKTGGVIKELEAELKINPDDMQTKEDLALAYSRGQRTGEAIGIYEDILKNSNEPRILVNLGFCYMGIDDRKSIELFDKVCQRAKAEPTDRDVLSLALTNLGAVYEKYSYYETAFDKYATAVHISPENHLAAKYLKQLEGLADPDCGLVGLRRLPDGKETYFLWDGSYFSGKERKIDVSDIKLK
jgi:tetratricopeptide (TPR) repeat protein